MTTHIGSCHCRRIKFEVEAAIDHVRICDCSICRRRGALNFRVEKHKLRLLTPWEDLVVYRWGSMTAVDYFCPICGILPFRRPSDPTPEELEQGVEPFDGWAINVRCIENLDLDHLPVRQIHGIAIQQDLAGLLPVTSSGTAVRLLRESDLPAFHVYRSDPALARYQGWSPLAEEAALAFLRDMSTVQDLVPGAWIQLGIADAATDTLLGDIGVYLDSDELRAEIGFTLATQQQGQGRAFHALSALLPLITAVAPVRQIRAVTDARNSDSIRLLCRLGFIRTAEYETRFKGEICTEQVYVRSAGDM